MTLINQPQTGNLILKNPIPNIMQVWIDAENRTAPCYVFNLSEKGSHEYALESIIFYSGGLNFIENLAAGYVIFFNGDPGLKQKHEIGKFLYYLREEHGVEPIVWMQKHDADVYPGAVLLTMVSKWINHF